MLELILIGLALALSVFSLARAWVPPQTRKVIELQGRIEDLEYAAEQTAQRLTRRARSEGAEVARAVHVNKSRDTAALLDHARSVVENAKGTAAAPSHDDPLAIKDALRARHLQ
jgi:hypothetical protein